MNLGTFDHSLTCGQFALQNVYPASNYLADQDLQDPLEVFNSGKFEWLGTMLDFLWVLFAMQNFYPASNYQELKDPLEIFNSGKFEWLGDYAWLSLSTVCYASVHM